MEDFADAVEAMMDARDVVKAYPTEANSQTYQEAKKVVSAMYAFVRDYVEGEKSAKYWEGRTY